MPSREIRQAAPATVATPVLRAGSALSAARAAPVGEVVQPSCAGLSIADNTYQARAMPHAYNMLAEHFRERPDMLVASEFPKVPRSA